MSLPMYRPDVPSGAMPDKPKGPPTWEEVEARCAERMAATASAICSKGISEREADFHRGLLAAYREIAEMPREPSVDAAGGAGTL